MSSIQAYTSDHVRDKVVEKKTNLPFENKYGKSFCIYLGMGQRKLNTENSNPNPNLNHTPNLYTNANANPNHASTGGPNELCLHILDSIEAYDETFRRYGSHNDLEEGLLLVVSIIMVPCSQ